MTPEEYQAAAAELARRSAMPQAMAAKMQQQLEAAFAPRDVVRPRSAAYVRWAVAAVLTVAAGAAVWYARRQPVTLNNVTTRVQVAPTQSEVRSPAATKTPGEPARRVGRHSDRRRAVDLPPVVQPTGFVPVPSAVGLPAFESGHIVRMTVPVTALPSYGVDISPAPSGEPVEADVLVGQDGLARAIRLVNTSRSQQ